MRLVVFRAENGTTIVVPIDERVRTWQAGLDRAVTAAIGTVSTAEPEDEYAGEVTERETGRRLGVFAVFAAHDGAVIAVA